MIKVILCLLFLSLDVLADPPPLYLNNAPGNATRGLTTVATADGKWFIADSVYEWTWYSAKRYCESNNMRLAKVTSAAQLAALKAADGSNGFLGSYWVDARDAHLSRQLSWDKTGVALDSYIHVDFEETDGYLTCVDYYTNGNFYAMGCHEYFAVLCEKDCVVRC